jgi:hypothetical protein
MYTVSPWSGFSAVRTVHFYETVVAEYSHRAVENELIPCELLYPRELLRCATFEKSKPKVLIVKVCPQTQHLSRKLILLPHTIKRDLPGRVKRPILV